MQYQIGTELMQFWNLYPLPYILSLYLPFSFYLFFLSIKRREKVQNFSLIIRSGGYPISKVQKTSGKLQAGDV